MVKFIGWPENLAYDGPLVEITGKLNDLYDEESDLEALFNTLDINTITSKSENPFIQEAEKIYNEKLKKSKNYVKYFDLKVITVDE